MYACMYYLNGYNLWRYNFLIYVENFFVWVQYGYDGFLILFFSLIIKVGFELSKEALGTLLDGMTKIKDQLSSVTSSTSSS